MKHVRYEKTKIYIIRNWKLHGEFPVVIVQVLVLVWAKDHSKIWYQSDF